MLLIDRNRVNMIGRGLKDSCIVARLVLHKTQSNRWQISEYTLTTQMKMKAIAIISQLRYTLSRVRMGYN